MTSVNRSTGLALGEYIASSRASELPPDLVEWIKLLTLDSLGCGLLASDMEWTQRIVSTLAHTEAPGPCLVWGTEARFSAANAALATGSAVQGFEFDDIGPGSHYGSVTTTVALALSQVGAELSGMDLLRSTVAGIEVGSRIAECLGHTPIVTCGFHSPGLNGALAAAATAAYCLELDPEQSAHALSNAAQFASGIMGVQHGGMGKRLFHGKAAHSGVLAAQLSAHGFTNVDDIFGCGYGSFPAAFTGGRDGYDLAALTDQLHERYRSYEIKFKMWACRAGIHAPLEAIRAIRETRTLDADEIAEVIVALPKGAHVAVGWDYVPSTATVAQLNLQYCMAIMLLEDDVKADQFTPDKLAAPAVLDLAARVRAVHDPSLDVETATFQTLGPRASLVTVVLENGERITQRGVDGLRGFDRDHETTRREVIDKFRTNTRAHLTEAAQATLIDQCLNLDALDRAGELLQTLTAAQVPR